MEALCKNVRKLSVASAAIKNADKDSIEAFASSTAGRVTNPCFSGVDSARLEYQFLKTTKQEGHRKAGLSIGHFSAYKG